jgi:hypothetical protein
MLRNNGNFIVPFSWIIEWHARVWQADPANYNWRNLNIILRALEEELARMGVLHSLS